MSDEEDYLREEDLPSVPDYEPTEENMKVRKELKVLKDNENWLKKRTEMRNYFKRAIDSGSSVELAKTLLKKRGASNELIDDIIKKSRKGGKRRKSKKRRKTKIRRKTVKKGGKKRKKISRKKTKKRQLSK